MGLAEIFGILILLMIVVFSIIVSFMKNEDQLDLDKIRELADVDDVEMTSHLFPKEKDDD
jgi:HAMP domain-containing protein